MDFDDLRPPVPRGLRRVGFVLLNLRRGGAELQAVELARRVRPLGWEPVFYLLEDAGELWDEVQKGFTLRGMTIRAHLPKWHPAFWLDAWRAIRKLARWFRRDRLDVVHSFLFWGSAYAVPAARMARVRGVVTCRLQLAEFKDRRPHYDLVEALLNRGTDAVMVNSVALREETVAREHLPRRRVVVIHNGIELPAAGVANLAAEFPALAGEGPIVAMVGNLKPIKRHDVFLRAFALALREVPSLRAVLCGADHGEEPRLRALAKELGVDHAVVFAGARDDVPAVLRACSMAALTSDGEGMPNAVLEAMGAGCVVVATAVGGIPELIRHGETGLLARAGDHVEIGAHLVRLAKDPALQRKLGENAAARIREGEFSPRSLAERHVQLWNAVYLFRRTPPLDRDGFIRPEIES